MIIVIGSINSKADCIDDLLALSLDHVRRSSTEPGCTSHAVYQDVENPLRLRFFEEWADRSSLEAHFAVPASRSFFKAATTFAAEPPQIHIYDANPIRLHTAS